MTGGMDVKLLPHSSVQNRCQVEGAVKEEGPWGTKAQEGGLR